MTPVRAASADATDASLTNRHGKVQNGRADGTAAPSCRACLSPTFAAPMAAAGACRALCYAVHIPWKRLVRYLNQLEPDALVARFAEHPPIGFRVVEAAGTPAFVAPFDLLTTADAQARDKLMRAPGYRWWGRLLRWRTAFVGTTVSEYALFPRGSDPGVLAAALRDALGRRQRLLIVKDIPQASPLFDDATAQWCRRFADACAQAGFVLLEGQALAYVPVDFASEEEYLARLSSGRRKDIRRKLRKREDVTVDAVRCGDPMFAEWTEHWGRDATRALLERHPDIDAIFAGSDQIARGVLDALQATGRHVPDDVAVIGYDNWEPFATGSTPEITSIDAGLQNLGRQAAQRVFEAIDGVDVGEGTHHLPVRLVIRGSTIARR